MSFHKNKLPVRNDVKTVRYWRNPTESEIAFGYGCIHYRDFPVDAVTHPDRTLKCWVRVDGKRYYR
jgi:hypothetical protein